MNKIIIRPDSPSYNDDRSLNSFLNNMIVLVVMASFGPSLDILGLGELTYAEVLVLLLWGPWTVSAFRSLDRWQRHLIFLFLLSAAMQLVSGSINAAPVGWILKRTGTYVLLVVLFLIMNHMTRFRPSRLQFALTGLAVSYVIVATFNIPTASEKYLEMPWRLGLGEMVTFTVCLILIWFPRMRLPGGLALLVLALVHVFEQARALAILTALTGFIGLYASVSGSQRPNRFQASKMAKLALLFLCTTFAAYQAARFATEERLFPKELQQKMELQFSSRYGLLAAARPQTIAALYAISKRPILGFGPGKVDRDVLLLYGLLAASPYHTQQERNALFRESFADRSVGTPSHSHILGAWADAGILASLCWFYVLGLCVYVLIRSWRWSNDWTYLYVFTSLVVAWDMLFSPGPIRLKMAVELLIFAHALRSMRAADSDQVARRAAEADAARSPAGSSAKTSFVQ